MLKLMLKQIELKLKLWKKKHLRPKHLATRSSSSSALPTSGWANLPEEILDEILKRVSSVDLLTCGVVCKSWQLMYINRFGCLPRNILVGVPILLLNTCKPDPNSWKFIKMSGELASDEIFMPEAANKWFCGSSCGWLVLEDTDCREVSLLNPLTRRVIRLPSVDTFTIRLNGQGKPDVPRDGFSFIFKAILSTNPVISEQDCIIMAIVGKMRRLSYCRIGDKKWTNVERCLPGLCDVIYYEGKFYSADDWGVLMSCDIIDPNSIEIVAMGFMKKYKYHDFGWNYLVMASGRLLLVSTVYGECSFDVHSLDKCNPSYDEWYPQFPNNTVETRHRWVEIDSIGDQLLFVGNNGSFSLPVQRHNGRENCIYFTDRYYFHIHDRYIGMYDIAKKSACFYNEKVQDRLLSSFWVTPTPW